MFAHVARVGARPEIVGIAGLITNDDPDRLTLKKGGLRQGVRCRQNNQPENQEHALHASLLRYSFSPCLQVSRSPCLQQRVTSPVPCLSFATARYRERFSGGSAGSVRPQCSSAGRWLPG